MTYQCPKSHGTNFVHVAKTYRYEPRTFLFWSWVAEVHTGYIARCTDPACARYWRIGLDGVHEPAGSGAAPVVQPPIERPNRDDDEPREVHPPLGLAVRRPVL